MNFLIYIFSFSEIYSGLRKIKVSSQLATSYGHRQLLAWFSDCLLSLFAGLALAEDLETSGELFHV